jgi:DNA invertase Pin-like site-specific DNA recombinase
MQLAELREYAGRRGWEIVEEFIDQGVSGCKESRPALNRMMADACRRRFDVISVWKIDRFGRSLKHLVNALAELAAHKSSDLRIGLKFCPGFGRAAWGPVDFR